MVAAAQQTLNELCLPVTVEQLTAIGAATLGAVIFIFAFMRKGKGTAKEDAMSFEVEYTPSTMEVLNQLSVEELKEEVASAQAAVEEARVIAARFKLEAVKAKEQATAKVQNFDLRTDLWGVGATAWALFTGIDLNKRHDVLRTREQGNIFGLQALSDIALDCPPPLEEIVMELLYIDPARRPGGTGEVLARIRAIASGFGLDTATIASARRAQLDPAEIAGVIDGLVDPLWASICRSPGFDRRFVKFEDGETLAAASDPAQHTVLLLSGGVRVEVDGRGVAEENREGTFLGAISTLTGAQRFATLRAKGPTWCCLFNEAELEQLVTCNPAVAVRMVRTMADRIASGPPRHRE